MIVTITQYRSLPLDDAGNVLPFAGRGVTSQTFTANGGIASLGSKTRFVGISSNVPLHLGFNAPATTSTPYHPAGMQFYEVRAGQPLNFIEVSAAEQVVPVNQAGVTNSGSITALNTTPALGAGTTNSSVSLLLNGATGFAVDVRGIFAATLTFQGTIDGTNWFSLAVLPAGGGVSVPSVGTTTAAGAWIGAANGMLAVRVTATAFASGTAAVVLRAMQASSVIHSLPTGVLTQAIAVSQGQTAHATGIAGNPVRMSGRAVNANYTAVTSGQAADIITSLVGAQIIKSFSIPEADWQSTQALTSTTPAAARAAGAAGIRNYVTGAQFSNSGGSAVDVIVLDGATEIWRGTVAANGFISPVFQTPLRGTPATALNVNLSAAGTVRANMQGYQAP